MNTKDKKSNGGFKKFIIRVSCLVFIVYFSITLLRLQGDINNKKQELIELQNQVTQQKIKNDDLQRILESGEESDYIERIAREKLGLGVPDERVYVVISDD